MKLKAQVEALRQNKLPEIWAGYSPDEMAAKREQLEQQERSLPAVARRLATLALLENSAWLSRRCSQMPLRDILAVRRLAVAQGSYFALVEALLEGLSAPGPRERYDCPLALDHLADERCVSPLHRLPDDTMPRVSRLALHGLNCDACKLQPVPVEANLVARVIDRAYPTQVSTCAAMPPPFLAIPR
jgi:hypothetical protein